MKFFFNRPKFTKMLMDRFLIFQFNICNSDSQELLPNKSIYFPLLLIAAVFDSWLFIGVYVCLMVFTIMSVALGKLFPKVIGVPLTSFYKKHASPNIFKKYCGNPFSAIAGSAGKILTTGGGRIAVAMGVTVLGQDAVHKAGIGQYPKYQFEKWANGGVHPSNQPFVFKDTGPSWADNISKWGKPN